MLRGLEIDPRELGALTVSMLKGEHGYQRKEVGRLCRWLATSVAPDVIVLTNILLSVCPPFMTTRSTIIFFVVSGAMATSIGFGVAYPDFKWWCP